MEKPLWSETINEIKELQKLAIENGVVCYTAYNHRFEPNIIRMKKLLKNKTLGKLYSCRMFYGNGTARLVQSSPWRDKGKGVLVDLGSHLLDICDYWFSQKNLKFNSVCINNFENKAPDHAIINSENKNIRIELEMTFCMWRNHFTCDILAENGSAHIESLCKWGPAKFITRMRKLPSGRPVEKQNIQIENDPTWALEFEHFLYIIASGYKTNLSKDIWIQNTINNIE